MNSLVHLQDITWKISCIIQTNFLWISDCDVQLKLVSTLFLLQLFKFISIQLELKIYINVTWMQLKARKGSCFSTSSVVLVTMLGLSMELGTCVVLQADAFGPIISLLPWLVVLVSVSSTVASSVWTERTNKAQRCEEWVIAFHHYTLV